MNLPFSFGTSKLELEKNGNSVKLKYVKFNLFKLTCIVCFMLVTSKINGKVLDVGWHAGDGDKGLHFSVLRAGIMIVWGRRD